MSLRNDYREQIEAYLNGDMTGVDRLVFEGRVESNPGLKEEFEHQNEIVESLKSQRIAELKTRLNNISVEPSLIGSLLESSILRPVAYAVTGLVIATGTYFMIDTNEVATPIELMELTPKTEYIISTPVEVAAPKKLNYRHAQKTVADDLQVTEFEDILVEVTPETASKQIQFEVPEVQTDMSGGDLESPTLVIEGAKRIEEIPSVNKVEKININTVSSRKYDFHYRMEDNRLFLYGEFSESPYEIIEINSPSSKSLYFYYNGNFYQLRKNASEVTPLRSIESTSLIMELEQIKSNR
jgi:hypothetical protein